MASPCCGVLINASSFRCPQVTALVLALLHPKIERWATYVFALACIQGDLKFAGPSRPRPVFHGHHHPSESRPVRTRTQPQGGVWHPTGNVQAHSAGQRLWPAAMRAADDARRSTGRARGVAAAGQDIYRTFRPRRSAQPFSNMQLLTRPRGRHAVRLALPADGMTCLTDGRLRMWCQRLVRPLLQTTAKRQEAQSYNLEAQHTTFSKTHTAAFLSRWPFAPTRSLTSKTRERSGRCGTKGRGRRRPP
jgi:hypothetical protein